jgi:hypothetical protein
MRAEGGRVDQVGCELAPSCKPMLLAKNGPFALIRHRDAMQPGRPTMRPRKDETPEEFRARQRERYANDPVYRERILQGLRERRRQRYANDPVYRERLLERQRKRYAPDPEYRQQIVERERKRYVRKMKGSSP